jgi:hypothetical protein
MSVTVNARYELERQRREELRREQQRRRAAALLATCRQELQAVREPAVQQLAAGGLKKVQKELERIEPQIAAAPDESLKTLQRTQRTLQGVIAEAMVKARLWHKEQAEARARMAEMQARARSLTEKNAATVSAEIAQLSGVERSGNYGAVLERCAKLERAIEHAAEVEFDETVRREVVRGLLAALQAQGFVSADPQLEHGAAGGVVTLLGRLPSGRSARFEVHLDGHMEFDLNGYEGRACAKEVDQIERVLQERFQVRMGPRQVTWKNPDKLSKGARNLPTGGAQAHS